MGRSAKLHKRVSKKQVSSTPSGSNSAPASSAQTQAQNAKKKATLKGKAASSGKGKASGAAVNDGVLGGADYVSLLMGGRKKAREEARKLPQDEA